MDFEGKEYDMKKKMILIQNLTYMYLDMHSY